MVREKARERDSKRIVYSFHRVGFAEMPDLNLKVTPVFGESQYSYALIHDILESRIRDEIKVIIHEELVFSNLKGSF